MNGRDRPLQLARAEPRLAQPARRASLTLALVLAAGMSALPWLSRMARAEGKPPAFHVIVHPKMPPSSVTREFVMNAFLKKATRWPEGGAIQPVDLRFGAPAREAFSKSVLGRSAAAVRNYWQQKIFTGRGVPPPEVPSDVDVIRYVREHPGGIGYVSSQADVGAVKVLGLR